MTSDNNDTNTSSTNLENQIATLTARVNNLEAKLEEILNKIVEVF